jgi:hypothetical protein
VAERLRNKILEKATSSGGLGESVSVRPSFAARVSSMNRGWVILAVAVALTASLFTTMPIRHRGGAPQITSAAVTTSQPGVLAARGPESRAPERSIPDPHAPETPILHSQAESQLPGAVPGPPALPNDSPTPLARGALRPMKVPASPAGAKKPAMQADIREAEIDALEAEMQLITAAQTALNKDERALVSKNLDEHESRFPLGLLREERLTLRVRLFCAERRTVEATRIARALAAEHPRSSHLASLRDSCVARDGDVAAEEK